MRFIVLGGLATNRDPVTLRKHYFASHFLPPPPPLFKQQPSAEGKKKKRGEIHQFPLKCLDGS